MNMSDAYRFVTLIGVCGYRKCVLFSLLLMVSLNVSDALSKDLEQHRLNVDNINASTLSGLIDRYSGKPYVNFNAFVLDLYITGKRFFSEEQHVAIGEFVVNEPISQSESLVVHRLLGVYTRLKYGGEARRMLGRLVSVPSVRQFGVAQHENRQFIRLEKMIRAYAKEFGLKYKNVKGSVYEVSLPGRRGGALIGLHAHADVAAVDDELWVLDNGTKMDPFRMTQVGDRLYGRGTQSAKNAIVVSMMAMRTIKEEGIHLLNDFKLLIDTSGINSRSAIPDYLKKQVVPDYNITLDGSYPVVIAEKGAATLLARFPVLRTTESHGIGDIIGLVGGTAANQMLVAPKAIIRSDVPQQLIQKIEELSLGFVASHGGDFSVTAKVAGDTVVLEVTGVSASVNPLPRLLMFIRQMTASQLLNENHFTWAAAYVADNIGLDRYGAGLGIGFEHEFMGPLTAVLTKARLNEEHLELLVDLRIPQGEPIARIESVLLDKLRQWQTAAYSTIVFEFEADEPMYRNPKLRVFNVMLDIAVENLDLPRKFSSSSNSTSIHTLPNGIQFGLSLPNEQDITQGATEFKTIDQLLLDIQIVTEMMMGVGLMRNLK